MKEIATKNHLKTLTSALRDVSSQRLEAEVIAEFHEKGEHCGLFPYSFADGSCSKSRDWSVGVFQRHRISRVEP
jgi:hypothetical protein